MAVNKKALIAIGLVVVAGGGYYFTRMKSAKPVVAVGRIVSAETGDVALIVSESVKFYPHFKYALQTLGTGFDLNLGNINLNKVSLKYVQFAWSLHLRTGRRVLWSQRSLG